LADLLDTVHLFLPEVTLPKTELSPELSRVATAERRDSALDRRFASLVTNRDQSQEATDEPKGDMTVNQET
jgi:hypothetical protein